jgi:hypothetical protein
MGAPTYTAPYTYSKVEQAVDIILIVSLLVAMIAVFTFGIVWAFNA